MHSQISLGHCYARACKVVVQPLCFFLTSQDLLCVLIDDGGFLVLSNQNHQWDQVRSKRKRVGGILGGSTASPDHGSLLASIHRWAGSSVRWTPT